MFKRFSVLVVMASASAALAIGCADGSGTPTSPSAGPLPTAVGGGAEGSAVLKATVPTPLSPANGQRLENRTPLLTATNAQGKYATVPFAYRFQVLQGTQVVEEATVGQGSGTTSYQVAGELEHDREFTWRVRAEIDGVVTDWSSSAVFRTPEPPRPAAGPAGGGASLCGPPFPGNPVDIVACNRAAYGTPMNSEELVEFLFSVASDLNAAGIGGGPYGVLRKVTGHNCNGFSCDIICAGDGGGQRQYDVLLDGDGIALPIWSGPFTGSDIRVDACIVP